MWKKTPIKDLGLVITGKTPPTQKENLWNGDIPFITPGDLNYFSLRSAERKISNEGLKFSKLFYKNTVLFSCIGYIGKTSLFLGELGCCNQQINAIIPNEDIVNPWFLLFALKFYAPQFQNQASVTTVPILNKSNFEKFDIPIPEITEQNSIAKILRTIHEAIEIRKKELNLQRELKEALMAHLFTNGTKNEPLKETEIGFVPQSWEVLELKNFTKPIKQRDPKKNSNSYFTYVDVSSVSNERFKIIDKNELLGSEAPSRARKVINKNDIIFATVRPTLRRIALVPEELDDQICSTGFCVIKPDAEKLDFGFLYFYLLTPYVRNYVGSRQKGATYPAISDNVIANLKIPMAGLMEQKKIANILFAIHNKIELIIQEISLIEEIFQAILEELMSGKISTMPLIEDCVVTS